MKLTKVQREQLRMKYDGKCAYCGCDLPERWHADHVEPVLREWYKPGGGYERPENDTIENLNPACPPCNIDKHSGTLEGWRGKLARTLDVLNNNQPTYRHAVRFGLVNENPKPIVFYFETLQVGHLTEKLQREG